VSEWRIQAISNKPIWKLETADRTPSSDLAMNYIIHPSTHLVTRDGREDALVRPGYELSSLNPPGNWRRTRGRPRQTWLHLSTHLVTRDGREDALVRPGYQLSSLNPPGNWRRTRGRPRQTWLPTISDDLTHLYLGLRLAYLQAQGRPSWRKTVETAMLT